MYAALGIPREDKAARLMWFANNFRAFGAPVLMLIHTPRYMGPPQWSDIGMWLQTIGLLLRDEGLDCCFQEAWAVYSPQIREVVTIPEDHHFFLGVAIGYRDPDAPVNQFDVPRADIDEALRWEGRSEEHTSELQSLMRTSYAVFCLKKKNTNKTQLMTSTILKQYTSDIY